MIRCTLVLTLLAPAAAPAQDDDAFDLREAYVKAVEAVNERHAKKPGKAREDELAAYDETFGFEEWSKVPGKKLRVRIHLETEIQTPPRFMPRFPWHSEIDFPVLDAEALTSPSRDGKFFFYGICHELGHVIAMWGDRKNEEDHHTWAHYTGVTIVERLAREAADKPFMKGLRDVKWRSLELERTRLKDRKPSTEHHDGTLALFIALHDRVGPKAVGEAINVLDRADKRPRINRVRYYSFKELRAGLLQVVKDKAARAAVAELLPE